MSAVNSIRKKALKFLNSEPLIRKPIAIQLNLKKAPMLTAELQNLTHNIVSQKILQLDNELDSKAT